MLPDRVGHLNNLTVNIESFHQIVFAAKTITAFWCINPLWVGHVTAGAYCCASSEHLVH